MGDLNSLIVEGKVTSNDGFIANMCHLTIVSYRKWKNKFGKDSYEKNEFTVICYGRLAELVSNKATVDCRIKVVGRIKSLENKEMVVVAEHINFINSQKRGDNNESKN